LEAEEATKELRDEDEDVDSDLFDEQRPRDSFEPINIRGCPSAGVDDEEVVVVVEEDVCIELITVEEQVDAIPAVAIEATVVVVVVEVVP